MSISISLVYKFTHHLPQFKWRIWVILILFTPISKAQNNTYNFITRDVLNFWEAVDSLGPGKDTVAIFQRMVLNRASAAFKVFANKWKFTASQYAYQIRKYPLYYQSLRNRSLFLIQSEDSVRNMVARFKKMYPHLNEADICVGFGNFSTGGNDAIMANQNLIYIGLEYHCPDSSANLSELSISTRDYVSRSNFFRTIIHELVHVQQKTHGTQVAKAFNGDLLAHRIITEGMADFIGKLMVPQGNNGNYADYGRLHETELKMLLKKQLYTSGSGSWFGGKDADFTHKPRDLGYFMGARIAAHYYDKHKQSQAVLSSLIEIHSIKKFIRSSGYFKK